MDVLKSRLRALPGWCVSHRSGRFCRSNRFWVLLAILFMGIGKLSVRMPTAGEGLLSKAFASSGIQALGLDIEAAFELEKPAIHHYLFVSDQRVVTVELISSERIIMNYINLGDSYELIQAPLLALVEAAGKVYYGHLIELEDPEDPSQLFQVSDLLKPGEFRGHTILGHYRYPWAPDKVLFKVGSKILELEPLSEEDFELVAAKIGQIDLGAEDSKKMLELAGFRRGFGTLYFEGSEGSRAWEDYFSKRESLPPLLLSHRTPILPSEAAHLRDPVVVRLSVIVSRAGGIYDVQLIQGIDSVLNKMAIETALTWRFLPGITRNNVAEARLTLNVVFQR